MPHQIQENLENIFRKIKDFLEKDPNIVFALVFGSAATGKLRKDSDIDVAIYVKNPVSGYELLSLMQKLTSPLLRHQVMKNRKELFIKDFSVYSKFRENTIDDYQEYLDVTNKLKKIEQYVEELKNIKEVSFEEFQKNIVIKRFIERNLELAIQQMIDVCKHIVSRLNLREPNSYADCFEILGEKRIVSEENLEKYKNMVKFRNLLIHIYDTVSDKIVYQVYKERLKDFEIFIKEIKNYFKI